MRRPLHAAASYGLAAALLLTPATAFAADDQTFAEEATYGNHLEVELGQMAAEQAENAEVKEFGKRLASDHAQAQEQLEQAAEEMDLEIPDGLNEEGEQLKEKLSGLSGGAFDKAYMEEMVKDHKKDISKYEAYAEEQGNALQTYASKTLPTLRAHREMAEQLNQQVQ